MIYTTSIILAALFTVAVGYEHFQDEIPNGDQVPNPCPIDGLWGIQWAGVGHRANGGAGPRNPFGLDWAKNGFKWDECICNQDSDKDGTTNGEELGDPECKWTPGDTPDTTSNIRHPGICEPVEAEHCKEVNFWLECQSMVPFECLPFEAPETKFVEFRIQETPVPPKETTYACTAFTFPDEVTTSNVHMIGAEALIGHEAILHHLVVYGCPEATAPNVTSKFSTTIECGDMVTTFCEEIIYIWSVGVPPDCFDPEYGVRLGYDGFKTIVMEFHWNNPQKLAGETDTSGVRFYYTPQLRPYDAHSIFIGQLYLELPPGRTNVVQESLCPAQCTQYMFPEPVFISQIIPHMHLLGKGMLVQLIRHGDVIQTLINETDYDYNYPKATKYKPHVKVMPGDEIRVQCRFDTTSQDGYIFWGDATSDEMCIAVTQYYPKQANATDCMGTEFEHANIGSCEIAYGAEHVYACWSHLAAENMDAFLSALWEMYISMTMTCDVTGLTCMDGCEQVISNVKKHDCLTEQVDGWTKNNLLPYAAHLLREFAQLELDTEVFILAFISCDPRAVQAAPDHREDHAHEDGSGGDWCVFEPPTPSHTATASLIAVPLYIVALGLSLVMLF